MTISISISAQVEAKLKERAAAEGKDPGIYAAELVEQAISRPPLDEILAPFRKQVAQSGMTDAELDAFYEDLRNDASGTPRDSQP